MNESEPVKETKGDVSFDPKEDDAFDRDFKPRGAIAFFIVLVLLGMVIWYGIYFLMLDRI